MLSVAGVLELPAVSAAQPTVHAAEGQLNQTVGQLRMLQSVDSYAAFGPDALVLVVGEAIEDAGDEALNSLVDDIWSAGGAGLMIQLSSAATELSAVLVSACSRRALPLVSVRGHGSVAAIGDDVQKLLRKAGREVGDPTGRFDPQAVFAEMTMNEAGVNDILAATAQLTGRTVVLETDRHRVLHFCAGPEGSDQLLHDWERRSRTVEFVGHGAWHAGVGWLVYNVGRLEHGWGRLVVECDRSEAARLGSIVERAAEALVMCRLRDRDRERSVRRRHHEALVRILTSPQESATRNCATVASGLPIDGPYVGLALRPGTSEHPLPTSLANQLDDVVKLCTTAAVTMRVSALIAAFDTEVRVLLPIARHADADQGVTRFADRLQSRGPVLVATGTTVGRFEQSDRTLLEALHVLDVLPAEAPAGVHRLTDVHLRGLLDQLVDDDRVRAFAERELGGLRDHDARHGGDLLRTARTVVEHWGSKSAIASRLGVSRPLLYERLSRIEEVLGVDLNDTEARTSLHVAFLWLDR